MMELKHGAIVVACLLVLMGCTRGMPPADVAADEAALRAVNPAWIKAYNAGDADGLSSLYTDDAVWNPPGSVPVRGRAAIRDFFKKDTAGTAAAGLSFTMSPATEIGISGDLGWEWGTFTATDKTGATVDAGKYLTVHQRKDGRWMIIRDIYNSDLTPAAPLAPSAAAGK